jgi:putative ABC transport system permease protein
VHMRDVVGLAVVALRQRRTRALLTVIGVAVGCFVLTTSLSIGQGIQAVLLAQMRKQDQLRKILVWPGAGGKADDIPESQLVVDGEMSEARRERLREAIIRRWERPARKAPPGLTAAQVEELTRLEHVVSVTPALNWIGKAGLLGKLQPALIRPAIPDDRGVARRVQAGRILHHGDRAGILVSELLVYRWGFKNESEVDKVLGRRARMEVTSEAPGVAGLLTLLNVNRPNLTPEEQKVLLKAMARLPEALAHIDLPPAEQKVLLKVLHESRPEGKRAVVEEQPIVGVFRDVERQELNPWDGLPRPVDVLVAGAVADKMYFSIPGRKGLPQVTLLVDHEDHLRLVQDRVKSMGMETFSLAEVVDQIRLNMLLIALACTFVALVALSVAALGIANTMLMSVLERTHEIGLMKAVGARDSDVLMLFLMEGALVGAAGALLGLLASWLVSFPGDKVAYWLVAKETPMRLEGSVFLFPPWLVFGVPVLVCLMATVAAVYPARAAARIDPVVALRQP